MKFNYLSESLEQTKKLANQISQIIENGDVVTLSGDLGTGKTTISQILIKNITGDENVTSPTFNIVQTYEGKNKKIWHLDLYRIEEERDVYELAIEEMLDDGIVIIEWPEVADNLLPTDRLEVELSYCQEKGKRRISVRSKNEKWNSLNND